MVVVRLLYGSALRLMEVWGSPGFVDRSQGYAGVSLGVEMNCYS
jgi:hypothetical protein